MKKILIVDDQKEIRDLLRMTLELAQSFDIHEAHDGKDAVEKAAGLQPDLVLMDVMMPGEIDGLEACRRIKAAAAPGMAPNVLLVSAKPLSELAPHLQTAGADSFMPKPFGPLQLVTHIRDLYPHPP